MDAEECQNDEYCEWKTGKWRDCNCSGWTKRRVWCSDALSNKHATMCRISDEPKSRMRCTPPDNCSCQKIRELRNTKRDGEYMLNLKGKVVPVYCHNMTGTPAEYITLVNLHENYASFYSRRAKDITKCPKSHHDELEESTLPYGTTHFSKIRIAPHSMRIIEDDFTFAQTSGKHQGYGTAGDCFSKTEKCPRGEFSINLEGTRFRIRKQTRWDTKGLNSTIIYTTLVRLLFILLV